MSDPIKIYCILFEQWDESFGGSWLPTYQITRSEDSKNLYLKKLKSNSQIYRKIKWIYGDLNNE